MDGWMDDYGRLWGDFGGRTTYVYALGLLRMS